MYYELQINVHTCLLSRQPLPRVTKDKAGLQKTVESNSEIAGNHQCRRQRMKTNISSNLLQMFPQPGPKSFLNDVVQDERQKFQAKRPLTPTSGSGNFNQYTANAAESWREPFFTSIVLSHALKDWPKWVISTSSVHFTAIGHLPISRLISDGRRLAAWH